ncbi:MAG: triple tyrosine motif-containing protein, partial [Flavobacteriales bacterium]
MWIPFPGPYESSTRPLSPYLYRGARWFSRLLLLLVLTLFLQVSGKTQTLLPKIRTLTPEEYEGHSQIFSTTSLPHGRKAYGTNAQVLIHDGEHFEHVMVGKGKDVLSMDSDSSGRLFIGGSSLMGMIVPDSVGALTFHSLQKLLPDSLRDFGKIWNVRYDGKGAYFNANEHLFYYRGDTMKVIRPRTNFGLLHHLSGRVVVREHDHGLLAFSGTDGTYLSGSDSLTKGKVIMSILEADGTEEEGWIVFTRSKGLYHYDPSTGRISSMSGPEGTYSHKEIREARIYSASSLDPQANPYGASYAVGTILNGLYLLARDGRVLLHIGRGSGLPSDLIWKLTSNDAGHLRAVTDDGIAHLLTGLPFTLTKGGEQFDGTAEVISRNIFSDGNASPLYVANQQGIWRWKKAERSFSMVHGIEGRCTDLHFHNEHGKATRLLLPKHDILLSIPALPKDQEKPSIVDTLSKEGAYSLAGLETPQGTGVLTGGRHGLQVLVPPDKGKELWEKLLWVNEVDEEIRWVGKGIKEGKPDSLRLWASLLPKGVVSVTTDTAFSGYELSHYNKEDGIPEGQVFIFPDPSAPEKRVLFGTDKGFYKFEGGKFVPDERYGPRFSNTTRQLFRFKKGNDGEVWISDDRGGQVKHLIPHGEAYRIDSTIFRALGIGDVRGLFPEEGRTWIGGENGLASYFPEVELNTEREWDCRLTRVEGSGDSLLWGGTFFKEIGRRRIASDSTVLDRRPMGEQPKGMIPELPYSKNRMEFGFAAPFPTKQEAVEYSYKLSGFDTAWSKWSKETKKEYTNLPEGSYTFKVKARNVYQTVSTTSEYSFTVLPPWYRSWGAYAGYSFVSIGLVWLIVRLNGRRLEAQKQRLEKTVEARTNEVREKNRALEKEKKAVEEQKERVEE